MMKGDGRAWFAVFGQPVGHSLSPRIHEAFAAQCGIALSYETRDSRPQTFAADLHSFFASGGRGANVTMPFKEQAARLCDLLSPDARRAGAVNTVYRDRSGRLCGANTDGSGYIRDLCENMGFAPGSRRILILGAGGAARGILGPLLDRKPLLVAIANRTASRARELVADFRCHGPVETIAQELLLAGQSQAFDLIVRATSGGYGRDAWAWLAELVAPNAACHDLAYGAAAEPFCAWGRAAGLVLVADGLGMLVEQAADAFRIWHGVRPATGPVLRTLRDSLKVG